jgi:MurNAc alpha-1-phosphate uridylyltransferase
LRDIVINAAHLADQLVAYLDDGRALGVTLRWSLEPEPLEVGGWHRNRAAIVAVRPGADRQR